MNLTEMLNDSAVFIAIYKIQLRVPLLIIFNMMWEHNETRLALQRACVSQVGHT